jgi:nitrite reductase/ring-hydroxylating ferredoxin subunit
MLNVSSTLLYTAALLARRRGRNSRVALAYCGFGVMLLGAYLGGHLVFGEQIGVNHARETELPTDFTGVLPASQLADNQPREVDYSGLPVVLVRRGERIHALYARCAHLAGPLAEGTLEDGSIRCPWHGSRFSLDDGRVLEGPATNPQPCFETRVVDGMIQVRAREPESP